MPPGLEQICVPVAVVNDNVSETCVETFSVVIESSDALIGSPSMIQVEVFDDDGKLDYF